MPCTAQTYKGTQTPSCHPISWQRLRSMDLASLLFLSIATAHLTLCQLRYDPHVLVSVAATRSLLSHMRTQAQPEGSKPSPTAQLRFHHAHRGARPSMTQHERTSTKDQNQLHNVYKLYSAPRLLKDERAHVTTLFVWILRANHRSFIHPWNLKACPRKLLKFVQHLTCPKALICVTLGVCASVSGEGTHDMNSLNAMC